MIGLLVTLGIAMAATPSGEGTWSIDYGRRYCSLIRQPADPALPALTFRQTPGSDSVELVIARRGWRSGLLRRLQPVDIVLMPSRTRGTVESVPIGIEAGGDAVGLRGIGVAELPPALLEQIDKNESLIVEHRGRTVVAIAMPSARKAFKALADCNDRVLAEWGVDMKRQATFRSEAMPVGSPSTWFMSEDYPASAIGTGTSDRVVALVSVAADGKVTGCRIAASDGNAALDEQTCRLVMARARYVPALDADARPVDSKLFLRVAWVAPTVRH